MDKKTDFSEKEGKKILEKGDNFEYR